MNDREMALLRRVVVSSMAQVMAAAGEDEQARLDALEEEFAGAPASLVGAADREADAILEAEFLGRFEAEHGTAIGRICAKEAELEVLKAERDTLKSFAGSRWPASGRGRSSSSHLDDDVPF